MSATTTTDGRPGALGGRLVGADGVRAFAAVWVVFSHLFQRLHLPSQSLVVQDIQVVAMKGAFGVSIFFVLSGMLLAYPFWTACLTGRPRPGLRRYARRRVARIGPGFYASLLVSFVVSLFLFPDAPAQVWRLVAGLTFTSGFHYVTFFPVESNGPLWSIGLEVVSYLLLAVVMVALFALPRRGSRVGVVFWVAVLGAVVALNQVVVTVFATSSEGRGWQYGMVGGAKEWMPGYNPLGFFGHFTIGVLAAVAIAAWRLRHGDRQHVGFDALAGAGAIGAGALVWSVRYPPEPDASTNFQGQPYLFPVFAALVAVVLIGLAHSTVLGRLVDNRFARYTAKVSFGIYIWHYLVLHLVSALTGGEFEYFGVVDPLRHTLLSAGVLAISYAVASASWFWLERPVLHSRWATQGPAAPAPDADSKAPAAPVSPGG